MIGSSRLLLGQLPLLLLPLLLTPPALAAATAKTVDVSSCQASLWQSLPLAKQATPSEAYHPTSQDYYQDWALKSILPPFVLACFAAALLLAFALWRLLKLATCVRCIRGPRHRSKAAADILAARTHRWLQVIVALLACGMVAGAGYGFSTIHPTLESRGVGVYEQAKAYVADGLSTANRTVDAVEAVEASVADVRQRVVDLELDSLQPGVLEKVDGFSHDIAAVHTALTSAIRDIQSRVLDRMQQLQEDWQPTADRLDVAKNASLYAAFAFLIAAAVATALGVALNCPGLANPALGALLVMLLLSWGAAWGTTTGLKVGSDGCQTVEEKFMAGLQEAAERQVADGSGVLATVGVGETLALGRYYIWGTGRNASEVLAELTGWDIWQLLDAANATVTNLQQASGVLVGAASNSSLATLPDNLAVIAGDLAGVASNVSALEAALSHERFHALYITVKQYTCCDVLNWLGGLWLALLIVGCCGVPLALAAFWWVGRMDRLEPRGCCHIYRRADYAAFRAEEEEEGGRHSSDIPELPGKKGSDQGGLSAASLSLRNKFAAAGAAGAWSRGGGAAGFTPRPANGAGDAFTIGAVGAAAASAGQQQQLYDGSISARSSVRGLELSELLPAGTPSAPALPHSACSSLPTSARYAGGTLAAGGSSQQWGMWAAAGSAPPSVRGNGGPAAGSASSSVLNSARGPGAGIPASVPLTPAAVALMPLDQEPSLSRASSDEDPLASSQETEAGGGGSALKRAGNALARLKFKRRSSHQ